MNSVLKSDTKSDIDLELISFALCPYVQRSVITLKHKKVDFKITYIDLKNKPKWFLDISPMGKVPILRVDGKTTIFESAVINEYIDETTGKPLMATDPLQRAFERSWIQFGSDVLATMYQMTLAKDNTELETKASKFFSDLAKLEPALKDGPYFRGSEFSLVDTSWAPIFTRTLISKMLAEDPRWKEMPKVRKWAETLVELKSVKDSVIPDFVQEYKKYCIEQNSLLFK